MLSAVFTDCKNEIMQPLMDAGNHIVECAIENQKYKSKYSWR